MWNIVERWWIDNGCDQPHVVTVTICIKLHVKVIFKKDKCNIYLDITHYRSSTMNE